MKILALEFSSNRRTVAVLGEHGGIAQAGESVTRATPAFALIEQVLDQAKLDRAAVELIVVGLGPGSYTGIRAAIAIAQGWQLACGVRLAGFSSVACLAAQLHDAGERGRRHLIVDAQRREFYRAVYEFTESGPRETEPLRIVPAGQIEADLRAGETVVGPDAAQAFPGARSLYPEAAGLARLASHGSEFKPGELLEPIYLRETSFVKAPASRFPS